jgi:biopolymer transport protein ExbB/TolQ
LGVAPSGALPLKKYLVMISLIVFPIALTVVIYLKYTELKHTQRPQEVSLFSVWFTGLSLFLVGIFVAVLNLVNAFDLIAKEDDIAPDVVAGVIKTGLIYALVGFGFFIVSLICWWGLKSIKTQKISK